jgi:transcriptional regulator with XRE-family HTH domain
MLVLHSGIVKHPCATQASMKVVFARVAQSLRVLKQAKHCGTLHVYAIVCGMTVHADSGPVYPDWSFGDRVRKARITTGMTQGEFAEAINVKEGTLAAWETNRAHPRSRDVVDVAKRIEAVTKIPTSWLLGIEDGPPPPPPPLGPFRQTRSAPVRYLHRVPADDVARVDDDAMAYLRLAEDGLLPRVDSNHQPFGYRPAA